MKKPPQDKKKLRASADFLWRQVAVKVWGNRCSVCNSIGSDIHHFFPRNCYGNLRLDPQNAVILCRKCHFSHHFKADPAIQQAIIANRGMDWYKNLETKSKERFISAQTIKFYTDKIKELKNYLRAGK